MTNRTENFTTDRTLIGSAASDGLGNWAGNGTWVAIGGYGAKTASTNTLEFAWLESGVSDVEIQVTQPFSGNAGICARMTDANNGIYARAASSGFYIYRWESGSATLLNSNTGVGMSDGSVLKLVVSGNNIDFYEGVNLRVSTTSSFNSTATKHGLGDFASVPSTFDTLSITAVSSGYTLTADSLSYTATSQNASFGKALIIGAAQLSYAAAIQDATLTYVAPGVFTLAADTLSFSFSLQNSLADYAVAASKLDYSVSVQDATLTYALPASYTLTCSSLTYTFTVRRANLLGPGDTPSFGEAEKYEKLQLMGYSGHINNMLIKYYQDNGATASDINTAEMQWLAAQGATKLTLGDRRKEFYESVGYTGTVTQMEHDYWFYL